MDVGDRKRLDKDTRDGLTELMNTITNEQFNEYIKSVDKGDNKYNLIDKRVTLLQLDKRNKEPLTQFKDIIMNKYKLSEHQNVIHLLKKDEYLEARLAKLKKASLNTNFLKYTEYKLVLVREFEKYYEMNPLDVGAFDSMGESFKVIDKQLFNLSLIHI